MALISGMVLPGSPPTLTFADYAHIQPTLAILRPYLRHAIESGRKGVNVYLYGVPGTGKSELAKVLARELGCELFEVTSHDTEGDPVSGPARLRAYRAAQSFFADRRTLIVFDEVEDVFGEQITIIGSNAFANKQKAWINRILEQNSVPALWISNSIESLDPAFIRRFDLMVELPVPPRKQREQIVRKACDGMLDEAAIARLGESEHLAPAIITRAASVVNCAGNSLGAGDRSTAVELLVDGTLRAQGHRPTRRNDPNQLPEVYDPAFIHADVDLPALSEGLIIDPAVIILKLLGPVLI